MIIVTGGAGFIGSNIVKELNNRGYSDILVVDDLTNGVKHKNLNRLNFTDYIDFREYINILPKFKTDVIIHQGACSDTTEKDGKFMMENNYQYSKTLWNYSIENTIRFLYASSASVYGDGDAGFIEDPKCEYPLNVYAYSKFLFDKYVNTHLGKATAQTVGIRYFNVYGPQENHKEKMASVPFHLYSQVKRGGSMKLFEGSENFKRDFIHVDDIVKINMFFLDNKQISGIFNGGTGHAEPFTTIASTVQSQFKDAKTEFIPFPDELVGKYQTYTQADLTKLRSVGYDKSFLTVEEGVKKYIQTLNTSEGFIV